MLNSSRHWSVRKTRTLLFERAINGPNETLPNIRFSSLYKEDVLALKERPQSARKAIRHREERFIATAPKHAY
jgi:hypothetical protein